MNEIFHVIKDPVHGTMQFTSTEDRWIKPFIDSPHFQRLRYIKQMGMGDFIFPGAVHTRFNHSLGCCYVASQIARKIGLDDVERQSVMIACLMHDIGHGPFSHAFEGLFYNKIRHELWTPYFLRDYATDTFFEVYNQLNPDFPLTAAVYAQFADMIMHRAIKKQVLADIVSSQLDADRLDYLLRDNHFCGVQYGEFDLRWMLHCLTVVHSSQGDRLGITHKGIGVVEHYLMARRLMVRNIYQSQKTIAFEHFMIQLLTSLAESIEHHPPFAAMKQTRLGQFLIAANQFNKAMENTDDITALKNAFLESNYIYYHALRDDDVFLLIRQLAALEDTHPAVQLAMRLEYRKMPKILRLDHADLEQAKVILQTFKDQYKREFQPWQLALIQAPHQSYSGEEDPILVVNEHQEIKPISAFSIMLNAMSGQLEHVAFLSIDRIISEDYRVQGLVKALREMSAP